MRATGARLLLLLTCVASASLAASCGSPGSSQDETPRQRIDLLVGDTLPLSGPSAALGLSAQKAARLAVERVNDAIGETGSSHALEIVHLDVHADGAGAAARRGLENGASCLIAPRSELGAREVARVAAGSGRALVISPWNRAAGLPGDRDGLVAELPPAGPHHPLVVERGAEPNPTSAFAEAYDSTDPPIGPARAGDGRQFDATVLCYLAAVAAGSDQPAALARRLRPFERRGEPFSWLELAQAIDALARGRPITYVGVTLRVSVLPEIGA